MSGIDPSALALQAVLAAQSSIAEATLELGAMAQSIVAQLKTGDLLAALVLAPTQGVDRIALFGQSLPAQLPPGILPGETLLLQVTGFAPTQIFVKSLGAIDPQNPPETVTVELPPEGATAGQQAALLVRPSSPPAAPNATAPASAATTDGEAIAPRPIGAVAPPAEVFVAASVQPSARETLPSTSAAVALPPSELEARLVVARGARIQPPAPAPARATLAGAPSTAAPPRSAPQNPNAGGSAPTPPPGAAPSPRAASAPQSANLSGARPQPIPSPSGAPGSRAGPPLSAAASTPRSLGALRPPMTQRAMPSIEGERAPSPPSTMPPPAAAGTEPGSVSAFGPQAPQAPQAPPISTAAELPVNAVIAKETAPAPQSASEVLLARLGIRATPATIAAAERAQSAPRQIAAVFSQAEALLSRYVAQPAVAAARNLLNFVAALDPEHPATLPQQLAAYVETVLGGTETKLTALVSALAETENQMPTGTAALPTASAEQAATPPVSGHSPPAVPSALPTAAPAVSPAHDAGVVIAQSSLAQDVKSTLLAMANDPQSAAIPGASAILNDAALTISAAQMHLLAANLNSDPRTLIVPIPVFFREGGAATELRIGRERSGAGERMTADNFHLGFLLDTTSLGTVAIDLETSGRRVSVRVKTERDGAAARFRTAFDSLRGRLEFLRYRVASMQAAVAARALVRPAEPPPAPVKSSASPSVDASA